MGFFSGGSSWSKSDSYSGLRGTRYFKPFAQDIPADYRFGMDTAKSRVADTNPFGITANGLTDQQNDAFKTLGDQLFANHSGSYASRGFLSPENISGVIGSSLTQAAPALMEQVYKNQLGNQSVMSDRFAQLLNMLNQGQGLLGAESHSESYAKGSNLLGGALAGSIGDLVTAAGKSLMGGLSSGLGGGAVK